MSRTAWLEAVCRFDTRAVRTILWDAPRLRDTTSEQGWNLLQICCTRSTVGDAAAARRQLAGRRRGGVRFDGRARARRAAAHPRGKSRSTRRAAK